MSNTLASLSILKTLTTFFRYLSIYTLFLFFCLKVYPAIFQIYDISYNISIQYLLACREKCFDVNLFHHFSFSVIRKRCFIIAKKCLSDDKMTWKKCQKISHQSKRFYIKNIGLFRIQHIRLNIKLHLPVNVFIRC